MTETQMFARRVGIRRCGSPLARIPEAAASRPVAVVVGEVGS
jgi:hypothetical protein